MQSGSTFVWDLITNDGDPFLNNRGFNYDSINADGGLTIQSGVSSRLRFNSAGSDIDWTSPFWQTNHSWLVFDNASSPALGNPSSIFSDITYDGFGPVPGYPFARFAWQLSGNDVYLNFTAVPEPTTFGGSALLLILYASRRKRRRRKATRHPQFKPARPHFAIVKSIQAVSPLPLFVESFTTSFVWFFPSAHNAIFAGICFLFRKLDLLTRRPTPIGGFSMIRCTSSFLRVFALLACLITSVDAQQVSLNANPLDPFPANANEIGKLAEKNKNLQEAVQFFREGNIEKLRESLNEARKANADFPRVDVMIARLLMAAGQWPDAHALLENHVA